MTIGFLGAGRMAEAIMAAALRGGLARPRTIVACDIAPERRARVRRRLRVPVTASAAEVLARCGLVVLAVKPQDLAVLLAPLAPLWRPRHLVLSIAAGRRLHWLQRRLGSGVRLVRAMPNLPLMVGAGMSVFCLGRGARPSDRAVVRRLLGCAGRVAELPERHFDAVTALSGSGPAFFAFVLQAMADAGAKEGLPPSAARLLAEQTMLGAAHYLLATGDAPRDFIRAVASPQGTTAAGLAEWADPCLRAILGRAIRAAARRSAQLSRA